MTVTNILFGAGALISMVLSILSVLLLKNRLPKWGYIAVVLGFVILGILFMSYVEQVKPLCIQDTIPAGDGEASKPILLCTDNPDLVKISEGWK